MKNIPSSHKAFWALTTFVVAFFLLFTGMRVPNLAHPHRPKPSQRAVIEKQVKAFQPAIKKAADAFAVTEKPTETPGAVTFRSETLFALLPLGLPPLFPNSSRSPPPYSA